MGVMLFIIVVAVVIYLYVAYRAASGKMKHPAPSQRQAISAFDFESPRLIQIIQESIEIINKTKNPQTAARRFDNIKRNTERLFKILPPGRSINYEINGRKITTSADLHIIDEEKAKWFVEHNIALGKSETIKETALTQWGKVFNRALEDGKVTWEEMIELQSLQEQLGLTAEDTNSYWSKVNKDNLPAKSDVPAEKAKQCLDAPPQEPWLLIAAFGKSSSKVLPLVLSSIQSQPSFRMSKGPNEEDIYEVEFQPDDILNFEQLWNRIKDWKSTIIKIRGEIIDRNTISRWLICYRDKLKQKTTNPIFCFGASPFTFNIFGCHRTTIRDGIGSVGMSWYHIGKFDSLGVFYVDREAITMKVRQDIYSYRICPALDIEKIKRGLMLLPDTIDARKDIGWAVQDYYLGGKRLYPVMQYKSLYNDSFTVSAGQFNVDIGVSARMADYYSSVSPQFKFVLDLESKAQNNSR